MKPFKVIISSLLIIFAIILIPSISKAAWEGYTMKNDLEIKANTKMIARTVRTIKNKGTIIYVIKEKGDWYAVGKLATKIEGYVKKSDILKIRTDTMDHTANDMHKMLRIAGFKYNFDYLKPIPINRQTCKANTDCTHFVTAVVYKYAGSRVSSLLDNVQWNSKDLRKMGATVKQKEPRDRILASGKKVKASNIKKAFSLVKKSEAKAGDIIVYKKKVKHAEILAENLGNKTKGYKVYNCGSNEAIEAKEIMKSEHERSEIRYILRVEK